ncbi:MAG: hypothetical protein K2R93_17420 [Gemmatimonadaceae bacterium]|nr:hypothetical protein [Gemmatimonadaceae bacterium]
MRPIITDPDGTRRVDTPRVVEVERHQGHRHLVVMPEHESFLDRIGIARLALGVGIVAILGGTGYWLLA